MVQAGHGSSVVAACNANRRDGAGPVRKGIFRE